MIFGRILARFRPHASKQGRIKDKPQQPLLEASENLKSIKELNQALKAIDQAIQNKTATNQQRPQLSETALDCLPIRNDLGGGLAGQEHQRTSGQSNAINELLRHLTQFETLTEELKP